MDSKLSADAGFQSKNACDSLYGQKHDEKYALYEVTCYSYSMLLFWTVLSWENESTNFKLLPKG